MIPVLSSGSHNRHVAAKKSLIKQPPSADISNWAICINSCTEATVCANSYHLRSRRLKPIYSSVTLVFFRKLPY